MNSTAQSYKGNRISATTVLSYPTDFMQIVSFLSLKQIIL